MAKVNGPLLSFGARGQLGKAVVYFPWKGVDAVRSYAIPANPKSTDQVAQRTKLTAAVAEFHGAEYTGADLTAWDSLADLASKALSGFNAMVQLHVNQAILTNVWQRIHKGVFAGVTASHIVFRVTVPGDVAPTGYYGKSKSALAYAATMIASGQPHQYELDISGLEADTDYYFTAKVGTLATDFGRVGIYKQRTSVA